MGLIRLKIGFLLLLHHSLHVDCEMSINNYIGSVCSVSNYSTEGGEFATNVRSVFSNLTSAAHPHGFAKATAGEGSERVYGLVQCRGDVDQETCNACISTSTDEIVHPYCGNSLDAIIWYEKCQLRYSNTDFFGRLNVENSRNSSTGRKAEDPKALYAKLGSLLKINLTSQATREPSGTMFATGELPYTNLVTIYGLVQCTGDTSLNDCKEGLNSIISKIESTCDGAEGCEIVTGSCRVRYDNWLFYGTTTTPTPSPPAPPSNGASNTTAGPGNIIIRKAIVISVLIAVLVITCAICGFCWWKREFCCFWRKKLSGLQGMGEEAALEQQGLVETRTTFLCASLITRGRQCGELITRGYMAPEYLLEGKVSVKIDVYSFGVLVLEIISGKKNFSLIQQDTDENLLNYVWRLWGENKALQVVDQTLEGTCHNDEILRCIHIGLLCVQEDASSRPRMSKVVAMHENSSLILPSILPPAPPTRKIRNLSSGAQTSSTASGIGSELYSSSY